MYTWTVRTGLFESGTRLERHMPHAWALTGFRSNTNALCILSETISNRTTEETTKCLETRSAPYSKLAHPIFLFLRNCTRTLTSTGSHFAMKVAMCAARKMAASRRKGLWATCQLSTCGSSHQLCGMAGSRCASSHVSPTQSARLFRAHMKTLFQMSFSCIPGRLTSPSSRRDPIPPEGTLHCPTQRHERFICLRTHIFNSHTS